MKLFLVVATKASVTKLNDSFSLEVQGCGVCTCLASGEGPVLLHPMVDSGKDAGA